MHATGRVIDDVSYGELRHEKGAIISVTFSPVEAGAEVKEPPLEPVLGKAEWPMIVHRIEPGRTANAAAAHSKLPAADYRVAS